MRKNHRLLQRLIVTTTVLVAATVVTAFVAVATATPALPAQQVWTLTSMDKAYPDSKPGSNQDIYVSAAGNEWEGAQIVVRSSLATHDVTLAWDQASDQLLIDNSTLQRVGYVHITRPTTYLGSKPGYYPDPLLPAEFGQAVTVPGSTTSFYVLFHVPKNTPEGDYKGTVIVTDGSEPTLVNVRLHVWGFGWDKPHLNTSLKLDTKLIGRSLKGRIVWYRNSDRILKQYYKLFSDYGLSPDTVGPRPKVSASGQASWGKYTAAVSPYLSSDGIDFTDLRLPWDNYVPFPLADLSHKAKQFSTYLDAATATFKQQGWEKKAYVYVVDEPITTSQERYADKLARMAHAASAKSGYRIRFLLTDDPRTYAQHSNPLNTFLFKDVDIWCPRYFYFFDRLSAIAARRRAGAEIWWYLYANKAAKKIPTWVIDKGLADERAMGWLSYQQGVTGILYFGTNRWINPLTNSGYRDPYMDPASTAGKTYGKYVANGEASLLYPGYAPSVGLNDPYAGPRSSLRFESLRDGVEDYEYLYMASHSGNGSDFSQSSASGKAFAQRVAAAVAQFTPDHDGKAYNNFPVYTTQAAVYQNARDHLGNFISRRVDGLAPLVASGKIVDAATGKPLAGALVSDGILSTHTHADGSFKLSDVLPAGKLMVTAAGHVANSIVWHEGDPSFILGLAKD